MLEELAKADKVEQMNQNRKRMKLHNHKKKVEELWNLKKQKIMEEKFRREQEREADRMMLREEEDLIQRQKQLLIQKHLPYIKDFCSTDLKRIGEGNVLPKKEKNLKNFDNYIFGVSEKQINDWERQKENRRYN
jgi:hypothetical protein